MARSLTAAGLSLCLIINCVMGLGEKQSSRKQLQGIVFILVLILQVYLCFTMRIQLDEPTYSALGYRFATGTRMFVDEWHISQMFGFLTMPFVWLFMHVTGSTDGVVLLLRFCYLIMSLVTLYLFMKKYGSYPNAFLSGIMILLFAPLDMMSLSYNTIGIHALLQAHCLKDTGKGRSFLAGILFSCAVLSTPYLVVLFIGLFIFGIIHWKQWTDEKRSNSLLFLAGITLMVVLFCIFVFRNASLSEVINGLMHLPERNQNHFSSHNPILLMGYRFARGGWESFGPFIFLQFAAMIIALISHNQKAQKICNLLGIASVVYFIVREVINFDFAAVSNLYLPLALAAFPSMLKEERKPLKILYFLFLLDSFFFGYSSNLGLSSFSQALVVSDAAVLLAGNEKVSMWAALVMVALTVVLHINFVPAKEGTVLAQGPMKGIRVPDSYADAYTQTVSFLQAADKVTDSKQYYLVTDSGWQHMLMGNHSSLNFSTFQDTVSKEEYIELFNENLRQKKPDRFLLIFSNTYQNLQLEDLDLSGYTVTPLADRIYLLVRTISG